MTGSTPRTLTRRGQTYHALGTEPHITRDGRIVSVTKLRTACKSCEADFVCTAGPKDMAERTRYLARRCPTCRPKRAPAAPRPKCESCGRRMPERRAG